METGYKTTIGLEIHAELKTATKMFCNSKNDADETQPNVNICPICMGHPVINKQAVKHVLKIGHAVGGAIADFTEFDRKNYFYPDIPKGYQISQYKYPLVSGGELNGVKLTRIHLEEDTASSSHDTGDYSLVDFNRAGVPLMELVTEPVIHSATEAGAFARELQLLLQYTGASEANMEKGEMRVEANISVSKTETFGTKVEVKNLNSFKAAEKAIEYEVKRHIEALERGEKIVQETRGWDEATGKTFSQRSKESAHDYRYFPDPDLPKLKLSEMPEFAAAELKKELPELPWAKRARYTNDYNLKAPDANFLVANPVYADFFEQSIAGLSEKKTIALVSNYLISDIVGLVNKQNIAVVAGSIGKITPTHLKNLVALIEKGDLSSRGAKDVIADMIISGSQPLDIANAKGLIQKSDSGELKAMITEILAEQPKAVAEYKAGKEASLQFLLGQAMRKSKGSGNPEVLKALFIEALK